MKQSIWVQMVKVTIFGVMIIGSVIFLGILLRPNPSYTDTPISAVETFNDMPDNSIEVIGYGSSRMWKGLDSMEMYENYGIGMYNYGGDGQYLNTTYLYLLESLRTQSPKVVIIEIKNVYNFLTEGNSDYGLQTYFTTAISGVDVKAQYLTQVYGTELESYVSYFIPIVTFQTNWKSLTSANFTRNSNTYDFYASMGYYESDITTSVEPVDSTEFEELPLSEESIVTLDNIVDLCDKNGVDIIFYVAPWSGEYNYSDAMAQYAEENGAVYFDMFDYMEELEISWDTDFMDDNHLNDSGAGKLANFFGEYIVENYDVTDMKTIENNLWETDSIG